MKKLKLNGAILLMLGMTGSAFAQNGFYAGASIGQTTIDACSGIDNCDDEDIGWKIVGGWALNSNLAFEAAWVDFGEVDGAIDGSKISAEIDGWSVAAKGTLPLNDQFALFGKFGMIMWDVEGGGAASGIDDDGNDPLYGLGAEYTFTDQLSIVGEWEWYDIDEDVDLFSVGVLYKF
ncbi:outer membrane beta-barrel protein [Neiella sp. HB171785]|uniref:Outer membrane beta-barrel protein n=1 Tax=Neiella litorisoli TaxID=2771431 RepID=A0A8J6UJ06_9GAMM|nr:outer membrane beta-barrel protein [Neiella litorisoli]MBD1389628.1 outer membrane beta-barrel protein [Neiella litorisoli]